MSPMTLANPIDVEVQEAVRALVNAQPANSALALLLDPYAQALRRVYDGAAPEGTSVVVPNGAGVLAPRGWLTFGATTSTPGGFNGGQVFGRRGHESVLAIGIVSGSAESQMHAKRIYAALSALLTGRALVPSRGRVVRGSLALAQTYQEPAKLDRWLASLRYSYVAREDTSPLPEN